MHELKLYLATIQNENCDLFDTVLNRISHESGVRPGSRLTTVIPMDKKTAYAVSLADEEAAVLVLSCPGEYIYYTDAAIGLHIEEYTNDRNI